MANKPSGRIFRPLGPARAPSLIVNSNEEHHTVDCPYCIIGKGVISVYRHSGSDIKLDMNQTPNCDKCDRTFSIRTRVIIVGVPLEEQNQTRGDRAAQTRPLRAETHGEGV